MSLVNCGLKSEAAYRLAQAWAARGANLRRLDLSRNRVGSEHVARALEDLLDADGGGLAGLDTLKLAWTGLSGRAAAAVARGLGKSRVRDADLSWNAFHADDERGVGVRRRRPGNPFTFTST